MITVDTRNTDGTLVAFNQDGDIQLQYTADATGPDMQVTWRMTLDQARRMRRALHRILQSEA